MPAPILLNQTDTLEVWRSKTNSISQRVENIIDGSTPVVYSSINYSTTLTGGTGEVNLGDGQFFKSTDGKIGINTQSPSSYVDIWGTSTTSPDVGFYRPTMISAEATLGRVQFSGLSQDGTTRMIGSSLRGYGQGFTGTTNGNSGLTFFTKNASAASAEAMRLTYDGRLGIGTKTPASILEVSSSGADNGIRVNVGADGAAPFLSFLRSRGTPETPTAVLNSQQTGRITTSGYDGASYFSTSEIRTEVDGVVAAGNVPGRIVMATSTGNGILSERLRVSSNGNIGIGTASPTNYTSSGYTTLALNNSAGAVIEFQANGGQQSRITGWSNALAFHTNNIERMRIDSLGNVLVVGGALGYSSGGLVAQSTSKNTAVAMNSPSGRITMHGSALAAGAVAFFTFTNNRIAGDDVVLVSVKSGNATPGAYQVWSESATNGSCTICLRNISSGSLSEVINLSFAVIRGSTI